MKVLVLSSSFPYPVDIGRKVILSGFVEYLVSSLGPANVTFAYIASENDVSVPMPVPCGVVALPLAGIGRRVAGAAWQSVIRKRHALQEMMLYSRDAAAQLREVMRTTAPDLVVVDTVRMAQYLEAFVAAPPRSILYLDDLYSLRYQRMIEAMRAYPDVAMELIGTFGRFLPPFMRHLVRGQTIQRHLLHFESQILEKREKELPRRFESVLLLNADEVARLKSHSQAQNITTVKPLLRAHRNRLPRRFAGEPTYLFLGNLGYPANAHSLSLFMEKAMPGLIRAHPGTRLIVVGRGATEDVRQRGSGLSDHVRFLDFVEDLAPLMASAAAMVVPLIYGSGLKMKVLDALYFGLPFVSTSCGIDGVPTTPGSECYVEDDIAAFIEPLTRLLDIDANQRMSDNGQKLYAEEFAPEVVWREYGEIFGTA